MAIGSALRAIGRGLGKGARAAGRAGAKTAKFTFKAGKRVAVASKRVAKVGTKGAKKLGTALNKNKKIVAGLAGAGVATYIVVDKLTEGRNLDILSITNEDGLILIKTKQIHNLVNDQEIEFRNTNSTPSIDGDALVNQVKSINEFYVLGSIDKEGTYGIINKDYTAGELAGEVAGLPVGLAADIIKETAPIAVEILKDTAVPIASDFLSVILDQILAILGINLDQLKIGAGISSAVCVLSVLTLIMLKFS